MQGDPVASVLRGYNRMLKWEFFLDSVLDKEPELRTMIQVLEFR